MVKTLLNRLPKGRITRWGFLAGLLLALVFMVAAGTQPKASVKERPFKATGASTLTVNPNDPFGASGTFVIVGRATHLGDFVFPGTWAIVGFNDEGGFVYEIHGTYTADNGDTVEIYCPDWGVDDGLSPAVSKGIVHIIGGTGRFADASGSYVGSLSPAPAPTLFSAQGTISY